MGKPPENQKPGLTPGQARSLANLEDLKTTKRQEYLDGVDFIIRHARDRIINKWTKNDEKLAWARALIAAISAGATVLRDTDLEVLAERILRLEGEVSKREH